MCRDIGPRLSGAAKLRCRTLGSNPSHGIHDALRRIHAVQILRHLRTQESASDWMFRIALNPCSAPVLNRDQHAASIGAIVRTRSFDNLLHAQPIIRCLNRKRRVACLPFHGVLQAGAKIPYRMAPKVGSYFNSVTSFSFALLISSIFLISLSVSFWISSRDRFSSSSV